MKLMEGRNHGLDGLKDFSEEVSVASEQSEKIRDSDNKCGNLKYNLELIRSIRKVGITD